MLNVVSAVLRAQSLILSIHGCSQPSQQCVLAVPGEECVPIRAPKDLDDVPPGSREQRLELLDDLSVTAYRSVETLQVAVDYKCDVVQLLARSQCQRADRLRFVHLTVSEHSPHVALGSVEQAPISQVPHEPRLVDRIYEAQTHRSRGELPEIGHQ